ncbi:phage tail family protein [Terribacillus saccharophilus]|uniref:hypothetical protein n=1 Tax=Terribacillus saccharophilus TaxID=361277 RepID=UPI002DC57EF2|nr:phage tail family protein [Terribacillus saccharophilus]MEC0288912.1 phage tail family protein [Terribacillus saccharophilus]
MVTVDGINLAERYNVGVYPTDDPIMPEIRNNREDRASYGSIDYRSSFGSFPFPLSCYIEGGDIREKLKEIIALFVDDDGEFKKVIMTFSPWGNVFREVKLTKQVSLAYEEDYNFGEFTLELIADDPFGKSINQIERYFGEVNLKNGPLEIPISYYGTYKAGFNFTFFGTISNFDIEVHSASGTVRTFHYTSASHSTYLRCDFTEFIIDDNGSNGLQKSSGDFLYLNRSTTKLVFKGDMTGSLNFAYREIYSTA